MVDRALYFGFSVVFEDLDGDGRPDIFVANDSNPNYFYRNQGDGTFEESAMAAASPTTATARRCPAWASQWAITTTMDEPICS